MDLTNLSRAGEGRVSKVQRLAAYLLLDPAVLGSNQCFRVSYIENFLGIAMLIDNTLLTQRTFRSLIKLIETTQYWLATNWYIKNTIWVVASYVPRLRYL